MCAKRTHGEVLFTIRFSRCQCLRYLIWLIEFVSTTFHGNNSSIRLIGWSAMRSITYCRYRCGSMLFNLHVHAEHRTMPNDLLQHIGTHWKMQPRALRDLTGSLGMVRSSERIEKLQQFVVGTIPADSSSIHRGYFRTGQPSFKAKMSVQ